MFLFCLSTIWSSQSSFPILLKNKWIKVLTQKRPQARHWAPSVIGRSGSLLLLTRMKNKIEISAIFVGQLYHIIFGIYSNQVKRNSNSKTSGKTDFSVILTFHLSLTTCSPILVPRTHDPFGLRQGSRPLAWAR